MASQSKLNPWYITGFVEGEGCFAIIISKHKTKKLGKDARLTFEIELRGDDRAILEEIQAYFHCGTITDLRYDRYGWKPHVKYAVRSLPDLFGKIIPFFRNYRLKGRKNKDFQLFCQAAKVFDKKKHLTEEGINKLLRIRKFMNERRPYSS